MISCRKSWYKRYYFLHIFYSIANVQYLRHLLILWTFSLQAWPELQASYSPAWYFLDGFTDIVFLLDISFQFRTGYLEQGLMVCESKKLAGHYFRSKNFLMDLIAITPLDLVQLKVGIMPILRFPRWVFKLWFYFEVNRLFFF